MFEVVNLTNNTITISDLRVVIGPKERLDLTAVARREDVIHSRDLKTALHAKKLVMGRQTVVIPPAAPPPLPVPEPVDEDKIRAIIEEVMSKQPVVQDVQPLLKEISNKLDNIKILGGSKEIPLAPELSISQEKLAELQQKSVQSLNLESSEAKPSKVVVLKNTNFQNIADQL